MWFADEKTELLKCLRAFFVSVIFTNTTNRMISVISTCFCFTLQDSPFDAKKGRRLLLESVLCPKSLLFFLNIKAGWLSEDYGRIIKKKD